MGLYPYGRNAGHPRLRSMPARDVRRLESLTFDNLPDGQQLHPRVLNAEYLKRAGIGHKTVEIAQQGLSCQRARSRCSIQDSWSGNLLKTSNRFMAAPVSCLGSCDTIGPAGTGDDLYRRRDDPRPANALRADDAALSEPLLNAPLGDSQLFRGFPAGYECLWYDTHW